MDNRLSLTIDEAVKATDRSHQKTSLLLGERDNACPGD